MARIWEIARRALSRHDLGSWFGDEWGNSDAPLVVGPSSTRTVVEPSAHLVIGPSPRVLVEKVRRPIWEEMGWAVVSKGGRPVYEGVYEVLQRSTGQTRRFDGYVIRDGSVFTAYIADPPPEIREHPKGPCFLLTEAPWFRVHWYRPARDVDTAILYVQRVLDEAINR
jgi:hypothetical protein